MKAISIKCPNCGAGVYVNEGKTHCFCSSCGEPIIIDPEIDTHVNVNVTYDKTREYEINYEEKKHLTALDRANRNIKLAKKGILVSLCLMIGWYALVAVLPESITMGNELLAILTIFIECSSFLAVLVFIGILIESFEKRNKIDGLK